MTEADRQSSRKRMLESTSSTSSTEDQEHSNLSQTANMREILHGISNFQHTLANFMIRLDTQGNHMEELTKEIRGRNGIQVRLEEVSEQANDTIYSVTELKTSQDKMAREISMLKDYVTKLEFKVKTQEHQILDLKTRSMENNVVINGIKEEGVEGSNTEALAKALKAAFMTELEMGEADVDNLQIDALYRMGDKNIQRKFPRPICVQFSSKVHKDMVMRRVHILKQKRSFLRMANQLPEETREKRKQMQELQQKYTDRNIETKLKGDKLIFTKSGNIYRDKVGPLPTADEVISNEPVKMSISIGNTIEDNGNRFASYASTADSFRQVRMSLINIMRQQCVSSASHNIYAYRFKSSDGITHEGSEDDGEVGAGRALLRTLTENDIQNTVVVVARWFGSKIGARRFSHIKNSGMSAVKGLLAAGTSEQS